jgi:hypothetical protein
VNWDEVVVNVRADGWRSIAGSRLELLLPVRQPLLDYLLQHVTWPKAVQRAHVTMHDGNRLVVKVTASFFGFSREIELRLRLAPELEQRRVILFIENQALLAAALALIGPALTLPTGVAIEAARIVVNLDELAAGRRAGDVAAQLAAATFEIRDGVLWVSAVLDVHAVDAVSVVSPDSGVAGSGIALPPEEELVALMRGARVEWRLRVAEPLANQLLGAAVDGVRHPEATSGNRAAMRPLLDALQSLDVHFEDGAVVLTGSAALP